MNLGFSYETYQQARTNLKTILFVILAVTAVAAGAFGPDALRSPFSALLTPPLDLDKLDSLAKAIGALLVVPSIIALFAIEAIGIHDLYDRLIVRWRERFDVDFILPRLYVPFSERVDRRFLDVAETNRSDFMNRLFYPFVRDGQPLIHPNLVRRFWESMTWYWATQLLELVLLAIIAASLLAPLTLDLTQAELDRGHVTLTVCLALLLVNRYWIRNRRASVRRRSAEEIDDIVQQHRSDLQQRMKDLANSYQIQNNL